jgi:hypothetical protein
MSMIRQIGAVGLSLLGLALMIGCGSTSSSTSAESQTEPPSTTTTTQTVDKAAPDPNQKPAFSYTNHSEHGDVVHSVGRFGPLLPASQSDVEQAVLKNCQDAGDGRELIRRLDITETITSGLAADVQVGEFAVDFNLFMEDAHVHDLLDYVMRSSQGETCYRDTGEENAGGMFDLGSLQPHQPKTFSMWVVLPDAITPKDPEPSAATLSHEGWFVGTPLILVDGAVAGEGGGELSVTE